MTKDVCLSYCTSVLVHRDSDWLPPLHVGSPLPLYEQIVEAVALAVASGRLEPGQSLPSVRKLAADLRINPNTAARSVRELEIRGLGETRRGLGSVVAPGAVGPANDIARTVVQRELDSTVQAARSLGISPAELIEALRERWQEAEDAAGV